MRETRVRATKYKPGIPLFIRYGLWQGRSTNWSTGKTEPGISVYRAKLLGNTVYLDDDTCQSLEGQGRLAFVVTGEITGIGSDGEPTLKGVKCVIDLGLHVSIKRL
jgi:hypothetical protein